MLEFCVGITFILPVGVGVGVGVNDSKHNIFQYFVSEMNSFKLQLLKSQFTKLIQLHEFKQIN